MRLITITSLFAVSTLLLFGSPAFAAWKMRRDARPACSQQDERLCYSSRFNPVNSRNSCSVGETQAQANAASKTWPGDMDLD
jgi:hypothetical protein